MSSPRPTVLPSRSRIARCNRYNRRMAKKTRSETRKVAALRAAATRGRQSVFHTAGGRSTDVRRQVKTEEKARQFLRQKTEEGHRAAGRRPPSAERGGRPRVDQALRSVTHETEDEKLLRRERRRQDFTLTDPWRVLRITGEVIEGFDVLADVRRGVSIFGSARTHPEDPDYIAAVEVARRLGEAGFDILTGAGPGVMEAANKGARLAGARSIGCSIELPFEQGANPYVDTLVNFRYFFVRKTMFAKYSDAFIIFPGGYGTLDEAFEALTLIQTGKIHQFPVVFFGTAYWKGLLDWLRGTMLATGKISEADLDLIILTDDPREAASAVIATSQAREAKEKKAG
jgi:uncharacterized protein (TIGR00730 family)